MHALAKNLIDALCKMVTSVYKMSLVRFLYTARLSFQKKMKTGSTLSHLKKEVLPNMQVMQELLQKFATN